MGDHNRIDPMPSTFKPYLIADSARSGLPPTSADVRAEAQSRLLAASRMAMQGRQSSRELRYLTAQIDYVAERLCTIEPVPADFRADYYWPQMTLDAEASAS